MQRLLIVLAVVVLVGGMLLALPWGVPVELWAARRLTVRVSDRSLDVVTDPGNGMVGVPSLGTLDGMLFSFRTAVEPGSGFGFHMHRVDRPLDIVFFDPSGRALETLRMEPCPVEPCEVYAPQSVYRWAIESDVGTLDIAPGEVLRFHD